MGAKRDIDLEIGLFFIGAIALMVLVGLIRTPFDPNAMESSRRFAPPGFPHFLGTDNFGRDSFSRIMLGARFTLIVALGTVTIGTAFGLLLGMPAGYFGGFIDEAIMRLIDALTSFPGILLALVMVTVMDRGSYTIIIALGILFIPSYTRIARNGTLQFKDSEFVKSAQAFGAGPLRIMFAHILPNIYPQLLSAIVVGLSNAILAESGMSYLGLGIQPPAPSWGRMLSEAQVFLFNDPWMAVAPGLAIMTAVLGFNYLGEGLRKAYRL
jgi:peptide/nickel transport system permease protein